MGDYPAAVIWDLDGTLIDSAPDLADALNTLLNEHALGSLAKQQVRGMIGNGVVKLIERGFRAAGHELADTELDEFVARFLDIYSANATTRTTLQPGVHSTLRYFADAGARQAVCTNKPERISRLIIKDIGIGDLIEAVVGGDSTEAKKPDPRPLRSCIDALSVEAGQCLMIGDSGVDVETARALDMRVGIVTFGYSRVPVDSLAADFLIDDFHTLPARVRELQPNG